MPEHLDTRQLSSPDWLLAGFEGMGDPYHLAAVSRETYTDSPFLDHRIQPMPSRTASASAASVDQALDSTPERTSKSSTWIVHTAFCASTLLASCLDQPGGVLVVKEPLVLSRLAQQRRSLQESPGGAVPAAGWTPHAQRVIHMCERAYAGEQAVVKPSNFANNLMPELCHDTDSPRRFVLMSSSLPELLVSVIKKREEAERLMPGFLASLLQDSDYLVQAEPQDLEQLGLLRQATVFWHCQRYQLEHRLGAVSAHRVHALTMQQFFDRPRERLRDIVDFAGLPLSDGEIDSAVQGKVFSSHSKNQGSPYSPEQHRAEARQVSRRHEEALCDTLAWAESLFLKVPPMRLAGESDPLRLPG